MKLAGGPQRMLSALQKAYPGSLSAKDLVTVLYAHRADGGPTNAERQITRYASALRQHGYPVISRQHSGYRLEKIEGA